MTTSRNNSPETNSTSPALSRPAWPPAPPEVERRSDDLWRLAAICLGTVGAVILAACAGVSYGLFPDGDIAQATAHLLFYLVVICIFPASAVAYRRFYGDRLKQALKRDFEALGLPDAGESEKGFDRTHSHMNYFAHWAPAAALTFVGVYLLLNTPDFRGVMSDKAVLAMRFGFAGAYVYCLQLIYRRYTTGDLQPSVYTRCTLTLIVGLVVNYVAFQAINSLANQPDQTTGVGAGVEAITAFALGCFPYLALSWIARVGHGVLGQKQRRSDAMALGLIDGISTLHEARLQDEGIDNIQNLAAVRIDELLMKTNFSAQEVVEWVDQAALYLYLDAAEIDNFRRGGVRTVSDFQEFWRDYSEEDGKRKDDGTRDVQLAEKRALEVHSTPGRLDGIYRTTKRGPNMAYIGNYWNDLEKQAEKLKQQTQQNLKRVQQREAAKAMYELMRGRPNDELRTKAVAAWMYEQCACLAGDESVGGLDALLKSPLSVEEVCELAWMAMTAGKLHEAIKLYEKAIQADARNYQARNGLAWLRAKYMPELIDDETLQCAKQAYKLAQEDAPGSLEELACLDTLVRLQVARTDVAGDGASDRDKAVVVEALRETVSELQRALSATSKQGIPVHPNLLATLVLAAQKFDQLGRREDAARIAGQVLAAGLADRETKAAAEKLGGEAKP